MRVGRVQFVTRPQREGLTIGGNVMSYGGGKGRNYGNESKFNWNMILLVGGLIAALFIAGIAYRNWNAVGDGFKGLGAPPAQQNQNNGKTR